MKKLSRVFSKLNKVPSFVWSILLGVSIFFANFYSTRVAMIDFVKDTALTNPEMSAMIENLLKTQGWLMYVLSALISLAIFELILSLIIRSVVRRTAIIGNDNFIKNVVRIVFSLAYCVIGLFSISYFYQPLVSYYAGNPFALIVRTAALVLIFLILAEEVLEKRSVGRTFMWLYKVYFAIYIILVLINIPAAVSNKLLFLPLGIQAGSIALSMLIVYFTAGKYLKKKEKEAKETVIEVDITPPPPDEIFKGFGF